MNTSTVVCNSSCRGLSHYRGLAVADTSLIQPLLPCSSSSVARIALVSLLTRSIHLRCDRTLLLLPGCTISNVCLPTKPWCRLFTSPNLLSLTFPYLSVLLSTFSLSLMLSFLTLHLLSLSYTRYLRNLHCNENMFIKF